MKKYSLDLSGLECVRSNGLLVVALSIENYVSQSEFSILKFGRNRRENQSILSSLRVAIVVILPYEETLPSPTAHLLPAPSPSFLLL